MIRTYSVRVDVLRGGATLTTLQPVSDPVVDGKSDAEIKTSMSGQFLDNPLVNWLTDELHPIQIIDGIEHPVGIFPVGTVTEAWDENGAKTISVEAYDRALILSQTKTETILHLDQGANYINAIENLLVDAGILLYLATSTSKTLATDREDWDIGTSYLTIINDLLREIGYRDIWFNASGFAVLQPEADPASNISVQYGSNDLRVLQRPCTLESDVYDRSNVFIVICSNPDLAAPLYATSTNNNPLSSLSVFKRGRRIAQVLQVDNIPDQQALDDYAQKLCSQSMFASETIAISTANLPVRGAYDTVALLHPDVSGVFQEIEWSLILAPGQTMIHQLRRSVLI